ncbi:MAG: phosphoribosylanthranilate isomerase [Gammaproteobacteria bacterium]|nr:phosphoribosylanthranilate isomerase [Gammaproteobacteria bacterium]
MRRTRVKICGITRVEDGLAAVAAGADAIGLVFYPPSPRCVTIDQAAAIACAMPAFVSVTALFVNAEAEFIREVLAQAPIDLLQFHGQECPEYCEGFNRPYIRALSMQPGLDLFEQQRRFAAARGLLLDSYKPGVPGGTGETFDWHLIPKSLAGQIILAGGLSAENVAQAIAEVKPYAVDVSGGVEAAKGIKDSAKIARFMTAVRG